MTPSPADTAAATLFVDTQYRPQVCPVYFERHRDELIRMIAVAEMQKRQHREFKGRREASQRKDLAA